MARTYWLVAVLLSAAWGQDAADRGAPPETWNLRFQATSIGQYHGSFPASYSGLFSLAPHPEAEVSLTSTLFAAWKPALNTLIVVDPEIAGGRGFSASNGIANFLR